MSATALPDELWRKIVESGINFSGFTYKDLCCLSISSRRLRRLSDDDSFWSLLFSSDFPHQNTNTTSSSSSFKSIYKARFEREREKKLLAHRRAVLRKESQIFEHSRKIREIQRKLRDETDKLKATEAEVSNLRRVRQASVALNVWQPEVVRGRQKQIVEQRLVSVESRLHTLEMEIRLCCQQIDVHGKAHKEQKQRLEKANEELKGMKYHPLREYKLVGEDEDECKIKSKKRKHGLLKNGIERQ